MWKGAIEITLCWYKDFKFLSKLKPILKVNWWFKGNNYIEADQDMYGMNLIIILNIAG